MNLVVLFILIGVVLLAFEVFMPGAVLGVLGGLLLLAGCAIAFYRYDAAIGALTTLASLALLGAMLWAEFVLLPKTAIGKKLFLQKAVEATSQPEVASAAAVGKVCEAITTLAPSGYVLLDGRRYEAWSQSGHIAKGETLRVISLDNFRLIVSSTKIP